MPSRLRSSSMSGQWMPRPAPASSQRARCSGLALLSRGYHQSGVTIFRPSRNETTRSLSVHATSAISRVFSSIAKMLMPSSQQLFSIALDHVQDRVHLVKRVAVIVSDLQSFQPNLDRLACMIDVDVRWLVPVATQKKNRCP